MEDLFMEKKVNKYTVIKVVCQIISLILIPGLFVDSFNGIKAFIDAIRLGDYASLPLTLLPTVLLIVVSAIFGRFFCGYMCSFGAIQDFFHYLGSKIFKHRIKRMPEKVDHYIKYLKYVVLVTILIMWCFGVSLPEFMDPWTAFGSIIAWNITSPTTVSLDLAYTFTNLWLGTSIMLLIFIFSIFVDRFFCRYLCPMGAIFTLVSKFRLFKIKKDREVCGACRLCTSTCKMGIPLYQYDEVNSGECIDCMKCVHVCVKDNAKCELVNKSAPEAIAAIAAAVTIGLYYVGNLSVNTILTNQNNITEVVEIGSTSTINKYIDGTYTGSGTGYHNATTTVSVTISNDKITSITTVSTGDVAQYYNRAFSTITSEIISSQSTSVNKVSGATFSSNGIISAVNDALSQALRS